MSFSFETYQYLMPKAKQNLQNINNKKQRFNKSIIFQTNQDTEIKHKAQAELTNVAKWAKFEEDSFRERVRQEKLEKRVKGQLADYM